MKRKNYESAKLKCVVCGPETNREKHTLFNFPKCPDLKAKWLDILNVKSINKRSRVCELHFEKDQFVKVLLKNGALPSLTANNKSITNENLPLICASHISILPKPR